MTQQYSLRWNNHQPNFISMFTTLLNTQTLVDVTLAAEGKHLQAHKVVLSACSTYFQALFMENPSRHPIVILKDVTFADLRTMVDFMYYGEVNVTEDQLPQVLDTAKTLKIKGLTEMPDSTSLTRSQGTTADFPSGEMQDQRHVASPVHSPRRKNRRRRSSTGSLQMVGDDRGPEGDGGVEDRGAGGGAELLRGDVTLSSVPQRRREYHDPRATMENTQTHQSSEPQNLNVQQLPMDTEGSGLPEGGQWSVMEHPYGRYGGGCGLQGDGRYLPVESSSGHSLKLRRSKYFKRQSRVAAEDPTLRKQFSEPAPAPPMPTLQKHESYPQYSSKSRRVRTQDPDVGSILIRAVTVLDRQSSSSGAPSTSAEAGESSLATTRASHTPAVRSGPPLSCNFCWNTVDECGRILRRKTQYHCPECRTNLCIVPCFHEYHDGNVSEAPASAR